MRGRAEALVGVDPRDDVERFGHYEFVLRERLVGLGGRREERNIISASESHGVVRENFASGDSSDIKQFASTYEDGCDLLPHQLGGRGNVVVGKEVYQMLDVLDPQRKADSDAEGTMIVDVQRGELLSDYPFVHFEFLFFSVRSVSVDNNLSTYHVKGFWDRGRGKRVNDTVRRVVQHIWPTMTSGGQ